MLTMWPFLCGDAGRKKKEIYVLVKFSTLKWKAEKQFFWRRRMMMDDVD